MTQVVEQADPGVAWATPAPVMAGTVLGGAQLNATARVPGVFTYGPAAGTTAVVGEEQLTVRFTPSDAGFRTVTRMVNLPVMPRPATFAVDAMDAKSVTIEMREGGPGTMPVAVVPLGTLAQAVNLTCTTTLVGYGCRMSEWQVWPVGSAARVMVTVAPVGGGLAAWNEGGGSLRVGGWLAGAAGLAPVVSLGGAVLLMVGLWRRRGWCRRMALGAWMCGVPLCLSGCGSEYAVWIAHVTVRGESAGEVHLLTLPVRVTGTLGQAEGKAGAP